MTKEIGCTECPYAGHIELKECPDAYTEISQHCGLYKHEPINSEEGKKEITNEEAQTILRKFYSLDDTENEAINLAIKALEFINENFPASFKDYLSGEQYRE